MVQVQVGHACQELTQKRNNHLTASKLGTSTKEIEKIAKIEQKKKLLE